MNFEKTLGKFYISMVHTDDFVGIAFNIGVCNIYKDRECGIMLQIGHSLLCVGFRI